VCSACASAVCSNDPFCCNSTWDGFCVSEVNLYCAFSCP
jgi:hypothetical protein